MSTFWITLRQSTGVVHISFSLPPPFPVQKKEYFSCRSEKLLAAQEIKCFMEIVMMMMINNNFEIMFSPIGPYPDINSLAPDFFLILAHSVFKM
jgi:hypothetical protein